MSPRQKEIIAALGSGEWMNARQLRDRIAPDTTLANIRVQMFKMRERPARFELKVESDLGPKSRGYRLVWSEVE